MCTYTTRVAWEPSRWRTHLEQREAINYASESNPNSKGSIYCVDNIDQVSVLQIQDAFERAYIISLPHIPQNYMCAYATGGQRKQLDPLAYLVIE